MPEWEEDAKRLFTDGLYSEFCSLLRNEQPLLESRAKSLSRIMYPDVDVEGLFTREDVFCKLIKTIPQYESIKLTMDLFVMARCLSEEIATNAILTSILDAHGEILLKAYLRDHRDRLSQVLNQGCSFYLRKGKLRYNNLNVVEIRDEAEQGVAGAPYVAVEILPVGNAQLREADLEAGPEPELEVEPDLELEVEADMIIVQEEVEPLLQHHQDHMNWIQRVWTWIRVHEIVPEVIFDQVSEPPKVTIAEYLEACLNGEFAETIPDFPYIE